MLQRTLNTKPLLLYKKIFLRFFTDFQFLMFHENVMKFSIVKNLKTNEENKTSLCIGTLVVTAEGFAFNHNKRYHDNKLYLQVCFLLVPYY